jgi:hypothetical protein
LHTNSDSETFTQLLIELSTIINIDLMSYPGLFDSRRQAYLARLLRLASRIGLTSTQVSALQFEKSETPEEKLEEIETQVELALQSKDQPAQAASVPSLHELLGSPWPFSTFLGWLHFPHSDARDLSEVMPHFMSTSLANAWKVTMEELKRANPDLIAARIKFSDTKLWSVLNSAHEALMNVPVGFVDLELELSVFVSALSDITSLIKSSSTDSVGEITGIIAKLKSLTGVVESYAVWAQSEFYEKRIRMIEKIQNSLTPESSIILGSLLKRFVNRSFVNFLRCSLEGKPVFPEKIKSRLIVLLELQVDGYIEAILRENAPTSISDLLTSDLCLSPPFRDARYNYISPTCRRTEWVSEVKAGGFEHELFRIACKFANQLGIDVLANLQESRRIKNFRLLIAACIQLQCAWNPMNDDMWRGMTDSANPKLEHMVLVLSRMVGRRNILLLNNHDETSLFFTAEDWISSFNKIETTHGLRTGQTLFVNWVEHHFLPHKFVRQLREVGFNTERIRRTMNKFKIPERLVVLAERLKSVSRKYWRIAGGPFHGFLSPMDLLHNLFRIEIFWGFMDDQTPHWALRDALETLFSGAIDLLEMSITNASFKIVTGLRSLDPRYFTLNSFSLTEAQFADLGARVATLTSDLKREIELITNRENIDTHRQLSVST